MFLFNKVYKKQNTNKKGESALLITLTNSFSWLHLIYTPSTQLLNFIINFKSLVSLAGVSSYACPF